MNTFVPNYYEEFKCIADKCTHNCCIGWEIDIDDDTLSYYNSLAGETGDKIRKTISNDGECSHFALCDGDRCPHLNPHNLCDIITELGEDAICDICSDHPRFRNFYSEFTEAGLGLCCEEAARIILNFKEPFCPVPTDIDDDFTMTEEEEYALYRRGEVFEILQNRDLNIIERFLHLAKEFDFDFYEFKLKKLCQIYLNLERLDNNWTHLLKELENYNFDYKIFTDEKLQIPFEQLACYFVYRHFADGMWDDGFDARVKFVLASCYIIGALVAMSNIHTTDQMAEFSRMYSAEVEYSDNNMDAVF